MKGIAGTVSGILWPLVTITLIASLFGLYLFLKMGNKEQHLNELYLRQLSEVARGFDANVASMRKFLNLDRSADVDFSSESEKKSIRLDALTHRLGTATLGANANECYLLEMKAGLPQETAKNPQVAPTKCAPVAIDAEQKSTNGGEPDSSAWKACSGWMIEPAVSDSPYPSSRLQVRICGNPIELCDDGDSGVKPSELSCVKPPTEIRKIGYDLPLAALFPETDNRFATLLLSTSAGTVLYQHGAADESSGTVFIDVGRLIEQSQDLQSVKAGKAGAAQGAEQSKRGNVFPTFVDAEINGTMYRAYLYPHQPAEGAVRLDETLGDRDFSTLYILGLIPRADIRAETLKFSSGGYIVLISIALCMLLAIVFIKLQLSNVDAALKPSEARAAMLAVVLLVLLGTATISTLAFTQIYTEEFTSITHKSAEKIRQQFASEIEQHLLHASHLYNMPSVRSCIQGTSCQTMYPGPPYLKAWDPDVARNKAGPSTGKTQYRKQFYLSPEAQNFTAPAEPFTAGSIVDNLPLFAEIAELRVYLASLIKPIKNPIHLSAESVTAGSVFENLFLITESGEIPGYLIRGTHQLVKPIKNPSVAARRYFQRALRNQVWRVSLTSKASKVISEEADTPWYPLTIERIFNMTDGILSTQFAMPLNIPGSALKSHINDESGGPDPLKRGTVLSFGAHFHSLTAPLLPMGLQFAVIQNDTGRVLFHSNERRSLVEEFFEEMERSDALRAYIQRTVTERDTRPEVELKPSSFDGLYRGKESQFEALPLHDDIPWTLVLFRDNEPRETLFTLLFAVSAASVLTYLFFVLLWLWMAHWTFRSTFYLLWPQANEHRIYEKSTGAVLLLAVIVFFVLMQIESLLLLIVAASVITAGCVLVLNHFFARSYALQPARGDRHHHPRRGYTLSLTALLLLTIAVPALVITQRLGQDLVIRLAHFDAAQLVKSRRIAEEVVERRTRRFCGTTGDLKKDGDKCDSDLRKSIRRTTDFLMPAEDERIIRILTSPPSSSNSGRGAAELDNVYDEEVGFEFNQALNKFYDRVALYWAQSRYLQMSDAADSQSLRASVSVDEDKIYYMDYRFPDPWIILSSIPVKITLMLLFLWSVVAFAIRYLAVNLMGINVPRSYLVAKRTLTYDDWDDFVAASSGDGEDSHVGLGLLVEEFGSGQEHLGILIRANPANLRTLQDRFGNKELIQETWGTPVDAYRFCSDEIYRGAILEKIPRANDSVPILVINNLESVAFCRRLRLDLLSYLEALLSSENRQPLAVIIACEVAPLYMLTQQTHYLVKEYSEEFADTQETVRWSRLLSRFKKYYDWNPTEIIFRGKNEKENAVLREVSAWPELYYLKKIIDQQPQLTVNQVVQFIGTHAGAHYRRRWNFCTKEEKLVLYQLSTGMMVNPRNIEPLEHLMRRGFVRRDPRWTIVSESFARYVRTAEPAAVYQKWVSVSEQSAWSVLRVPLFAVLLAIVGLIMYSAQEASQSFLAITASLLAIIPALLRSWNMIKGASPASNSD